MSNKESLTDLQKKWYEKLKKSGFEDIESSNGALKVWASSYHKLRLSHNFEYKEAYARKAGQFLHEHKFSDSRDRHVWEMHCEGISIRETVKRLKKKNFKAYKFLVEEILARLKKEMLIWIGKDGEDEND